MALAGYAGASLFGSNSARLHIVVPARHRPQHAVHGVVVRQVAAGQQGQRTQRQALAQQQAALDAASAGLWSASRGFLEKNGIMAALPSRAPGQAPG